jgi:hypothetical protein
VNPPARARRTNSHETPRATRSVESQPAAAGAGFTTYIGGLDYQVARTVTDGSGNTYITGNRLISAESAPFFGREITDVFVTKLSAVALDPGGSTSSAARIYVTK